MVGQKFDTVDVLRLEVAEDPPGLENMVQNPNGDLGGWGWNTPVADSFLATDTLTGETALLFTGPSVSQATHFLTENLPIAAGEYAAATIDARAGIGYFRARFEWVDSAGALLSSSTQTAYTLTNNGPTILSAVVAPASTAYVRLRVDLYSTNAGADPIGGSQPLMTFNRVTVAKAATSGELGQLRTNLIPNPGFVTDTQGWEAVSGCTIARSTAQAQAGAASLALTATGTTMVVQTLTGKRGIPVTGGATYTASIYFRAATTARSTRVTLGWYNSSGTLLSESSSTDVVDATGSWTRRSVTGSAPASAAFLSVKVTILATTVGEIHYVDSGLLEKSATVGTYFDSTSSAAGKTYGTANHPAQQIGTSRTNLLPNPSLETNTTGWTTIGSGETLARVATPAVGSQAARLTSTSNLDPMGIQTSPRIAVTPGVSYTAQAQIRKVASGDTAKPAAVQIVFYDAAGVNIGLGTNSGETSAANDTLTYATRTVTAVAPANAATARVRAYILSVPTGHQHLVDALIFETTATFTTYFDGDSTTVTSGWFSFDRQWSGTAHASTSLEVESVTLPYHTEFASNLGYIEPVTWLNILGSAYGIRITRPVLDLGRLEANLADVALDPAVADTIRPGRRIRCTAWTGTVWSELFTGTALNAKVEYDLRAKKPTKRAKITLTAVDNTATLANIGRAGGVETIAELPFVLEGCGVPWNVNGSGDQVPSATVVAVNDDAKAIDQVAITRDSQLGHAWVSRVGVLNVWDAAEIDATLAATLDEAAYSDAQIDYDTERCINEVTVNFLRNNGTSTEEVPYGPYVDSASRELWGPHAVPFRIQWADEDATAIEAYADAILTANATPVIRVNSVRVPIRETTDLSTDAGDRRAFLDLMDLVTVSNDEVGHSSDLRITRLEHVITPKAWTLDVGFMVEGTVAAPQATPAPPAKVSWWPEVRMLHGEPSSCPPNFLVMDGSSFSVSEYPQLAAHLVALGLASGVLPNYTDRMPIGAGTKAIGTSGGSATKTLDITALPRRVNATAFGATATIATPANGTFSSADPIDIMPPWRAVYFIIRAR